MDYRTLTIRINTDFRHGDTLHTVYIFELAGAADDPVPRVQSAIAAHVPFDHYAISDTRSLVQSDTRGEFQMVIFSLGGLQYPEAAEAIVGELVEWALDQMRVHGSPTSEQSLSTREFLAQTNVTNYFGVSGELRVTETHEHLDGTYIRVADDLGNEYLTEVRPDGYHRIRKVRGAEG
ncbi:MAG: hypothetical protein M3328_01975 [Chloroflexota bacterium]|nr:hypothetical protein [Chloroflexota bacterium]